MKSSRLLSILMLLQLRGRVSAAALAREFEVSVRTIYRDVDALSASGAPVYAERGRQGGIALHAGWRTQLTGMTRGEARSVPLAGLAGVAEDLGLGGDAAAARLKIMASLPDEAGADAQGIAARFHLDPLPWYHRAESLECLPLLAAAVWHDRRVRLDYASWAHAGLREVGPLGLVLKGGIWYLVAQTAGRPRSYRVSSIRRLEVLEASVQRPPQFELAAWWPRSVAQFEARLMRETATVCISGEGLNILRAVNPAAAERALSTQRASLRAGWIEAELPVESPAYTARQLLRLGTEVEVLAPAALRAALAAEAAAVAALYAQTPRSAAFSPAAAATSAARARWRR